MWPADDTGAASTGPDSAKLLFARVQVDVKNWGAPLIAAIQGGDLPIWSAEGYYGYHAIVLYGYASNNAWIQYDTPSDSGLTFSTEATGFTTPRANSGYLDLGYNPGGKKNSLIAWKRY
ncbi:hypothetical protein [Streptomyces sp. NPDC101234]|uniref:hypothetical protein n=1 Tax=Streptomyces sp. NPDC101234 TaxID=3366138 RepID=UPI00380CC424